MAKHKAVYAKYREDHAADYASKNWDYASIVNKMKATKIKCVKYNYSLEKDVQEFFQFDGLISLSDDDKRLILTLKKYSEKPIHVLEPDPHTVKKKREQH